MWRFISFFLIPRDIQRALIYIYKGETLNINNRVNQNLYILEEKKQSCMDVCHPLVKGGRPIYCAHPSLSNYPPPSAFLTSTNITLSEKNRFFGRSSQFIHGFNFKIILPSVKVNFLFKIYLPHQVDSSYKPLS